MKKRMKVFAKSAANLLFTMAATTVMLLCLTVAMDGMWLFGVPEPEELQAVQITDRLYSNDAKEFSDEESLRLAVNLTNFLKYKPWGHGSDEEEARVAITYCCKDGSQVQISANENTVWWKGKALELKQENAFLKLCEGIFFLPEAMKMETAAE